MPSSPTLLVYDDAVETSEVLAAVYQPRGFNVERRSSSADPENVGPGNRTVVVTCPGGETTSQNRSPRVVIGGVARSASSKPAYNVAACRISSLFDYRELVGAIDRLLCGSD